MKGEEIMHGRWLRHSARLCQKKRRGASSVHGASRYNGHRRSRIRHQWVGVNSLQIGCGPRLCNGPL